MKLLILIALCAVPALGNKLPTIVGGRDVNPPGKWPWQASLQFRSSNSHTCGGSLISTNWVLCAAHCVGSGASRLQIVLGMHDRTTQRQGSPKKYMISSITRHPQYSQSGSQGFPNDIAVIRLSTAATLNNFVAPITLAASNAGDFVGSDCWITGWGRLYGNGPLPNILQEANIDVLSQSECQGFWGSRIKGYHVCLGDKANSRKGACNGDSGGPLVCKTGSSWTLVGVTSWGRAGCSTQSPSVYARVSYFRSWINQQTGI